MAGEWIAVPVQDIAKRTATGPFGSAISSKHFVDYGVPVIRGSNLSQIVSTRLDDSGLVFVSEEKAQEFGRSEARRGDLIFTCWGTIDQVGLIDSRAKYDHYIVSNKQMLLTPEESKADSLYLYYYFASPETRAQIINEGIGSSVPGFNLGQLRSFKVPLPPLAEQKAIAAVLGALDDKIELNRQMNATLEAMARALFQSWFVDFDPVRAKLDGRQPAGLDPATAALFSDSFQDSEAGNIPKGWEVAKLKELTSKIGSGATPRGGSEVYVDEGPALIRSQNVYDYEFRWPGLARLTDKSAEELKNVEVMKNDVLLNITGDSILRTCVVDPAALPARVNQHVAIIRAINDIPAHYLHLFLAQESMKSFLIGMSAGATRHAITKGHLESIDVLKPSTLVLKAFEQRTTPWFAQIDGNRSQSRTLATLRDMLLPKLLSGELKTEGFIV
jgi:type I restriction enzyme S subunit